MQKQKDEDEFLPDDAVEIMEKKKEKKVHRVTSPFRKKFVRAQGFVSARPPHPYIPAAKLSRI